MNPRTLILQASFVVSNRMDLYNKIFNFLKMRALLGPFRINSKTSLKKILPQNLVEIILCNLPNFNNNHHSISNNSLYCNNNWLHKISQINLPLKRKKLIFLLKSLSMKKQKLRKNCISRLLMSLWLKIKDFHNSSWRSRMGFNMWLKRLTV